MAAHSQWTEKSTEIFFLTNYSSTIAAADAKIAIRSYCCRPIVDQLYYYVPTLKRVTLYD